MVLKKNSENCVPTDLVNGLKENKFSAKEANEVSAFLDRAYIRLGKWFQWFNTTQSGELTFHYLSFLIFTD